MLSEAATAKKIPRKAVQTHTRVLDLKKGLDV